MILYLTHVDLVFQMGQCFCRVSNASKSQDLTDPETGIKRSLPLKRTLSPDWARCNRPDPTATASAVDPGGESSSSRTLPRTTFINPSCGTSYIRAAGVDDSGGIFSRDVTIVSRYPCCPAPACPNNTPLSPIRPGPDQQSAPSTSRNVSCQCAVGDPTHNSTPSKSENSRLNEVEVNLNTISSQLDTLTRNLQEQSSKLVSVASDTTRLVNNSELYLTAHGSFLDSSVISPPGPSSLPPSSKRVKIFEDNPAPLHRTTPMPLPLYPNFARSARANLLPEFEQVADENKENISQGSDIVLDDTIVPTSEDSK